MDFLCRTHFLLCFTRLKERPGALLPEGGDAGAVLACEELVI